MTLYELDSTATNSNTVTNNELGGGQKVSALVYFILLSLPFLGSTE